MDWVIITAVTAIVIPSLMTAVTTGKTLEKVTNIEKEIALLMIDNKDINQRLTAVETRCSLHHTK